ncbi:DUF6295 family protein [Cryptosporangium sp. NPDC051539]|uniref:DUF6295 family protein n=1 Tax=Cryptosporangium sp. NPDC051539 TaxID=3363962 RepID=UPI0037AD4C96
MCTYETATLAISGAGKGREGWFPLTDATVYFDHPVSAPQAHTLNIDFRNPSQGAAARVAVELDPAAARQLAESILAMLDAAPPGLVEESLATRAPTS